MFLYISLLASMLPLRRRVWFVLRRGRQAPFGLGRTGSSRRSRIALLCWNVSYGRNGQGRDSGLPGPPRSEIVLDTDSRLPQSL